MHVTTECFVYYPKYCLTIQDIFMQNACIQCTDESKGTKWWIYIRQIWELYHARSLESNSFFKNLAQILCFLMLGGMDWKTKYPLHDLCHLLDSMWSGCGSTKFPPLPLTIAWLCRVEMPRYSPLGRSRSKARTGNPTKTFRSFWSFSAVDSPKVHWGHLLRDLH